MMNISTAELLEVGVVVGTHGLRGDLKIRTLPTGDLALQGAQELYLKDATGVITHYDTVRISQHKQNYLVRLAGMDHINAVTPLVGQSVWMHSDDVPELPEEQFYWHQLEGLEVVDRQHGRLGRVSGMFATAAHDILEVTDGHNEILIPAVPHFILQVDPEEGRLLVDLPEGLVPGADQENDDNPL